VLLRSRRALTHPVNMYLRDFNRIGQRQGLPGQIGRRLLGLGLVMFRKRDKRQLDGVVLDGLKRRTREALQRGAEQDQCSRTANTCANILKLWPALWNFTTHGALVPTNNAAEQALRSLVLKRKISGPRAHCAATSSWPVATRCTRPAYARV
jgi:transposase